MTINTATVWSGEMASVHFPDSNLAWFEVKRLPLFGRGWDDTPTVFDRLPARAEGKVPEGVWTLGRQSAGLCLRFCTGSREIGAVWDGGVGMDHMPACGVSGLDLYERGPAGWRWCGVGRPQPGRTTTILRRRAQAEMTEYLLYLPLYNRVTELWLGLYPEAELLPPRAAPWSRNQAVVFYGTSITQGGCASRPGMCHPAILGRWLEREVINLGFSGSGKMEPIMAELLGELTVGLYVLDCLQNMSVDMTVERLAPFVRDLRERRPGVPILLVEEPGPASGSERNRNLRQAYRTLTREGINHLHYLTGTGLLKGVENGTVDGIHPTDLGFVRMARAFYPKLKTILAD